MEGVECTDVTTTRKRDRRSDHIKESNTVYFLLVSEDDRYTAARVKIGYTAKGLDKRLRDHKSVGLGLGSKPLNIQPVCAVHGSRTDEKETQRFFSQWCLDSTEEVFKPSEQIAGYIRWLRDQWFVWCPDDDKCELLENIERVDSSLWLPSADRTKPAPSELFPSFGPLRVGHRDVTGDDFYTNSKIIACAKKLFGQIDLDPASHAVANRVVQARRFYTLSDDGLSKPWNGRVWLNPPFSQWSRWVPKILNEVQHSVLEMCILVATRTITAQYFSPLMKRLDAICILEGRIPFWGSLATSSPDDGHAIIYIGPRKDDFGKCFEAIGNVIIRRD